MPTIQGFHHCAIRSADFDRSESFYLETLGLKSRIRWGEPGSRATMIDAGDGNYIEIFERPDKAPEIETVHLHFALRTDDCSAMLEIIREAGMEVTMETKCVKIASDRGPVDVKIAFFKGPDGELIELFENKEL